MSNQSPIAQNISKTKSSIVQFISDNPNTQVVTLIREFTISKQAMQRHLKELIEFGIIEKRGAPPHVRYNFSKDQINVLANNKIDTDLRLDNFEFIDAVGKSHKGSNGLKFWTEQRGYNYPEFKEKYLNLIDKYKGFKTNGLIEVTNKFTNVFKTDCSINNAFISEFSSIEIFGKTPLYAKLLLGKQSQDKSLFKEIFTTVKPQIIELIEQYDIDTVAFVPPTVKRETQLMIELERYLKINLPTISVTKIKNKYIVPQKSLSKPSERIQNAKETFVITYQNGYYGKNILIIDDFIESGSSINYIAQSLKSLAKIANSPEPYIVGYALAGSPNGIIDNTNKFEVINEV
jgi:hypothetical protein